MKIKINKIQGMAILRHGLTFIGGVVVMFGYLDESIWTELSGSIVALSGVIWSIVEKNKE